MSQFDDPGFAEALVQRLGEHSRFKSETRWFDGSILLQSGSSKIWLKVYRGQILETLPFLPPLGYTFKVGGPTGAWGMLFSGERCYADLVTPGVRHFADNSDLSRLGEITSELSVEGNLMEASRMTEAVHCLIEVVTEIGKETDK